MNHRLQVLSALSVAALAAGCAASAPQWESRFGDSARQLRAQQTIDAAAPQRNAGKVPPAQGGSVLQSIDRYRTGGAKTSGATSTDR